MRRARLWMVAVGVAALASAGGVHGRVVTEEATLPIRPLPEADDAGEGGISQEAERPQPQAPHRLSLARQTDGTEDGRGDAATAAPAPKARPKPVSVNADLADMLPACLAEAGYNLVTPERPSGRVVGRWTTSDPLELARIGAASCGYTIVEGENREVYLSGREIDSKYPRTTELLHTTRDLSSEGSLQSIRTMLGMKEWEKLTYSPEFGVLSIETSISRRPQLAKLLADLVGTAPAVPSSSASGKATGAAGSGQARRLAASELEPQAQAKKKKKEEEKYKTLTFRLRDSGSWHGGAVAHRVSRSLAPDERAIWDKDAKVLVVRARSDRARKSLLALVNAAER